MKEASQALLLILIVILITIAFATGEEALRKNAQLETRVLHLERFALCDTATKMDHHCELELTP